MHKDNPIKRLEQASNDYRAYQFREDSKNILGFNLSPKNEEIFIRLHKFLTNPEPSYILDLRTVNKGRWADIHISGLLNDVQNALCCVYYHAENIIRMEQNILSLPSLQPYITLLKETGVSSGGGNSLKLDFEYQALILAVRRCLEYLTRSLSACFKDEFNSFRNLSKHMKDLPKKKISNDLSEQIILIFEKYEKDFNYVMFSDGRKSLRDKISHFEYVAAGVINISEYGLSIHGGGDNLGHSAEDHISLSSLINSRTATLQICIEEYINTLIDVHKATISS